MDLEQIVTAGDYHAFVRQLSHEAAHLTISLDEYLRSVLAVAMQYQHEPPTFRLLAQALAEAFTTPPLPFDPTWLEFTEPPRFLFQFDDQEREPSDSFDDLRQMLCYQIADLHRMQVTGQLNDPYRYYGLISPAGHDWYNFDPPGFLACASSSGREDAPQTECSWDALTITLWLGQIYE
jgi:hypothetical protein